MAEAEDIIQSDLRFAKEMIRTRGEVTPMFVLHGANGVSVPVATPFGSDEEKAAVCGLIRAMCATLPVVAYSMLCEAWSTRVARDDAASRVRPSESPDRREVVMATAVTRAGCVSAAAEILRDGGGRAVGFGPDEVADGMAGPFASLLPPAPLSEEVRGRARELVAAMLGEEDLGALEAAMGCGGGTAPRPN